MPVPDYRCTKCRRRVKKRTDLIVKRAVFRTMGNRSVQVKSRATAWLCEKCLYADPDFQLPENSSPGAQSLRRDPS